MKDERIQNMILQLDGDPYDCDIENSDDYLVHYHLSSLRRSLLCWYPFDPTWSVLEIGCGFGALTGLLAENATYVDALEPDPVKIQAARNRYCGQDSISFIHTDPDSYTPKTTYDCIVLTDYLKTYRGNVAALFKRLSSWLSDDGIILACFHNRYGAAYQCGAVDDLVSEPHTSFRMPGLYTRREIESLTPPDCGLPRFYYPFPNAAFPQIIFTDDLPPSDSFRDRILLFDPYESNRKMSELALYDVAVQNSTLSHVANDYLVEFRKTPARKPQVIRAVLAADRPG